MKISNDPQFVDNAIQPVQPDIFYGQEAIDGAAHPWKGKDVGSLYVEANNGSTGVWQKRFENDNDNDWLRLTNPIGIFNVLEYGADPTGAVDSSVAIQAAIDAAAGTMVGVDGDGGVVLLPPGIYIADNLIARNLVTLQGAGMRSTTIKAPAGSSNPDMIHLPAGPVRQFRVRDMKFMNAGNPGQHCLNFTAIGDGGSPDQGGSWNGNVENVWIVNFEGMGIGFIGGATNNRVLNQHNSLRDVRIDCEDTSSTAVALDIQGYAGQNNAIGCTFNGSAKTMSGSKSVNISRVGAAGTGIPYSTTLVGCTFQTAETGLYIERSTSTAVYNGYFEELHRGVDVVGGAGSSKGTVVDGCRFANVYDGSGTGFFMRVDGVSFGSFTNNYGLGTIERVAICTTSSGVNGGSIWTQNNSIVSIGTDAPYLNLTKQLTAASTLDVGLSRLLFMAGTTPIDTITSWMGPGETFTIKAHTNPLTFTQDGNLVLGGHGSPFQLPTNGLATFVRDDVTGKMRLVSASPTPDGVYNVKAYGAVGNGTTDDRAAINAAITAANAAGGGTVYMPPGTYLVTAATHPNPSQTGLAGIVNRTSVSLVGAGQSSTIIKLADNQDSADTTGVQIVTHYDNISGGSDSDMTFRDFTIDGNYANQSGGNKLRDRGLAIRECSRVTITRVTIRNVYGTAAGGSPSGEGFCFQSVIARDITYTDCIGYGDGFDTTTATNYGASSNTNIKYNGCIAYGSGLANGFAVNNSSNIQYVNCHAYLNKVHGFNLEFARHIIYTGCIAGGIPATQTGGPFACTTITTPGISKETPSAGKTTVTAVSHGLTAGEYIYIGGNVNPVAQTEIVGMVQANDAIYKVGPNNVTSDTFELQTPAGVDVDSSAYGTWTAGGVVCPILGNEANGFRSQGGRDVEYNSCQAIANGYGAQTNHGINVQGSGHRITVNGGVYRFNRASGVYLSAGRPDQTRFAGSPYIANNYGGTNLAVTIKNLAVQTTITATITSTSITLADSAGMANGDRIEIILDNGDSHITTVSDVAPGASDTVTIDALPSAASNGNAVYLLKAPVMTWPATAILSNPETTVITGRQYTNEYPFPVMITVTGGTTVVVIRSGTTTGFTNGQFIVPPGGTITITHAGAPTWRWFQA